MLNPTRSLLITAVLACIAQTSVAEPSRSVIEAIKVGGRDGWDYASFDPMTHMLYIAHGSAIASVNVITKSATPHLAVAQGAHIAIPFADGTKLLITHGKGNMVTLNDAKTGSVDATISTDAKPDAAIIEPTTGRVFVMANGGGRVDVIDLRKKSVIARIDVGGAPEAAAVDGHGLVYTHLEDRNAIVVIDAKAMKVKATYAMSGCDEPSGIAVIRKKGLILSACANQIARFTNAKTGTEVASLPLGKHPDSAFWDDDRQLGYVPCGDGTLTVIDLVNDAPHIAEVVTTQAGARTGALDPMSGAIYLPTAEFAPPVLPGGRPIVMPDTLKVLVVGTPQQKEAH